MTIARSTKPIRKNRYIFRVLFATTLTTTMVATSGFGTFPENQLTKTFQIVISESFPPEALNPFNAYMANLSAPQILPNPDSVSDSVPPLDPFAGLLGLFEQSAPVATDAGGTPFSIEGTLAALGDTQTEVASVQQMRSTMTQSQIQTLTAMPNTTATMPVLITQTVAPTAALAVVYPAPVIPSPVSIAPTPVSAAFNITMSTVSINGYPTSVPIAVSPGDSVVVFYDFQVSNDPCPSCYTQLVTGFGTTGAVGGSCAFDAVAGASPGSSGSESIVLTAPATPGTYNIVVEFQEQPVCSGALTSYGSGSGGVSPQVIGQFDVVKPLMLYSIGPFDGNLGGIVGADDLCGVMSQPGYTQFYAFLSFDPVDSISTMMGRLSLPSNAAIKSSSGIKIANNWVDLLDGAIINSFQAAGVTGSSLFWSGAEDDTGNNTALTANCNGFTSNAAIGFGNYGDTLGTGTGWLGMAGNNQGCDIPIDLICLAVP